MARSRCSEHVAIVLQPSAALSVPDGVTSPFPPPPLPGPAAPAGTVGSTVGVDGTGTDIDSLTPRRRGSDVIALALLAIGMATFLVGVVLTADQYVATTTREARHTEVDRDTRRGDNGRRREVFSISGVDDDGATFDMGVSSSVHRRASVGDRVTIERSMFTGRVVEVRDDDWSTGRTVWDRILGIVLAAGGIVLVVTTARSIAKGWRLAESTGEPAPTRRIQVAIAVAIGVAAPVLWVLFERSIGAG